MGRLGRPMAAKGLISNIVLKLKTYQDLKTCAFNRIRINTFKESNKSQKILSLKIFQLSNYYPLINKAKLDNEIFIYII